MRSCSDFARLPARLRTGKPLVVRGPPYCCQAPSLRSIAFASKSVYIQTKEDYPQRLPVGQCAKVANESKRRDSDPRIAT